MPRKERKTKRRYRGGGWRDYLPPWLGGIPAPPPASPPAPPAAPLGEAAATAQTALVTGAGAAKKAVESVIPTQKLGAETNPILGGSSCAGTSLGGRRRRRKTKRRRY